MMFGDESRRPLHVHHQMERAIELAVLDMFYR